MAIHRSKEDTIYRAYLLHSRADRAIRLIAAQKLDKFELTMMEWLLMATVCHGPKGGMSMTEVAHVLDVTLPQVTALMNDLLKRKLLKQKISPSDRRSRRLVCTMQGSRLVSKIESSINDAVREWLPDIPQEQLEAYLQTVETIAEHKSE